MNKKTIPTRRIAVIDEEGKQHTIIEETDFILASYQDGSSDWAKGSRRFKLNGQGVNFSEEDGTYRCPHTDRVFTPA